MTDTEAQEAHEEIARLRKERDAADAAHAETRALVEKLVAELERAQSYVAIGKQNWSAESAVRMERMVADLDALISDTRLRTRCTLPRSRAPMGREEHRHGLAE